MPYNPTIILALKYKCDYFYDSFMRLFIILNHRIINFEICFHCMGKTAQTFCPAYHLVFNGIKKKITRAWNGMRVSK